MNCASCGAGLLEGATFCGECGAKVENADVLRITLDDLDSPTRDTSPTPAMGNPTAPLAPAIGTPQPAPAFAPASGLAPPMYSPTPPTRPRSTVGMAGAIIGVIGAATVVIGSLVSWIPEMPININAFKIEFGYLTDYASGFTDDNNGFGILLVVLAVIGAATSFVPKAGLIRNICGAGVLVVVILYLIQVNQGVRDFNDMASGWGTSGSASLGDSLGAGFYVTAVGGLLMAAAPPRWR